jgi:hypothetical protein
MAITALGDKSKTVFLKGVESHKIHHEFEVATGVAVKVAQPVKLNNDGLVVPAAAGDGDAIIGYSIHDGAAGELVTVAMRAYVIVYAMTSEAVNAGPVEYGGVGTEDPEYMLYVNVDTGSQVGWALDKATGADELIRVALK